MAYAQLLNVDPGDPLLASEGEQNKDNWDYTIDSATGKIETDLVTQDSIEADAVGTSELRLTTGGGTIAVNSIGAQHTVTSAYAHYPSVLWTRTSGTAGGWVYGDPSNHGSSGGGYLIEMTSAGSSPVPTAAVVAYEAHIACPPHAPFQGCGEWGMFLFLLRLRSTALELMAWMAESPPWNMDHRQYEKDDPEAMEGFRPPLRINEAEIARLVAAGEHHGASPGDESQGIELVMIDTRSICLVETTFCPVKERATIALAKAAEITDDVIREAPEGARRQYLIGKRAKLLAQAERPAALVALVTEAEERFATKMALASAAAAVLDETRERALSTRGFLRGRGKAAREMREEFRLARSEAKETARQARQARDMVAAAKAGAEPKPMKARDALIKRAPLHGLSPWELLKKEHPEVPVASSEALEGGKRILSGVPDFDESMVILRP